MNIGVNTKKRAVVINYMFLYDYIRSALNEVL